MSTGTINYTHRGYIVVELNQQMNTIHLHRSRNSATKGILFEFCMEFFHSEKETPWIECILSVLHERWWNLCAVAIKWSRSNDNFETTNAEFQRKKRSEPSIMNPKPVHADYSRKLQKVLFIYILPLSFGLFPTKRGKNGLCAHLITFATTLFSVHIRFSNFRFWCKEWNRNSNINTECSTQNCNPFFSVSFILLQNGASLFTTWSEYEAKNVLCFCHFLFLIL